MMKAVLLSEYGATSRFQVGDIAMPVAGAGEVLVRVHAVSVNPADTKLRAHGGAIAPALPAVLGMDLAGEVVAIGAGVERFAVGDRVFGCAGGVGNLQGTLAEFVAADARLLARMPDRLSYREAAALPLVSITAWEGLVDRARVEPGERVLVYGATGGVGHVAVQLAKALGADVTATASTPDKARIARELGADRVIVRGGDGFDDELHAASGGSGFDVVFDTVGGANLEHAIRHAALYGRVISLVTRQPYHLGDAMNKALSIHIVFMLVRMIHDLERARHGEIMARVAGMVDDGTLRPLLDPREFRLEESNEAFECVAGGSAVGKVVIDVSQ